MKNKRFVRHLKCFFLDHLWVILLFLAAPTFIMTVYLTVINENPGGAWWYYVLLSLFVLLCFLLYRCRTDFADIQNKKECGGNIQWQNHYLRNWAEDTKDKRII